MSLYARVCALSLFKTHIAASLLATAFHFFSWLRNEKLEFKIIKVHTGTEALEVALRVASIVNRWHVALIIGNKVTHDNKSGGTRDIGGSNYQREIESTQ